MTTVITRQSFAEADPKLLELVRLELDARPGFVLWMQGEMGAGKTSFVRAFLYRLGLGERTPVVSPTYTIMNEYLIGADWYAHLDLYRADERFSLDEIGVRDARNYRGFFVEWPEQGGPGEVLQPTHILRLESDGWDRRFYTLLRLDQVDS